MSVFVLLHPRSAEAYASQGMAHYEGARWMVAGVAWTKATCGTLADGAAWRRAPEGTSTLSPTKRLAKVVSGKSFPQPRRGDFRGERTCWEVAINALGEDDPAGHDCRHRCARWTIASRPPFWLKAFCVRTSVAHAPRQVRVFVSSFISLQTVRENGIRALCHAIDGRFQAPNGCKS